MVVSFSAEGDDAIELERAASGLVASEATMVLSEAGCKSPHPPLPEGRGEVFFLPSSFEGWKLFLKELTIAASIAPK